MVEPYLELEERYAGFTGSKHAISCSSGTAALHLSLLALGVGPGNEVILPDYTMGACAFAVSYTGATPVFVDVSLTDYNIIPEEIEKAITSKTKAIMVVDLYGRLCNMKEIHRIASLYGLPIIEDACEAHGAPFDSRATMTCYSFFKNKIIHGEEGGMVTTDNGHLAAKMNWYKNMCFGKQWKYHHTEVGYNYRMANSQARLVMESMDEYPENVKKRRQIESWYAEALQDNRPPRDAVWFYDIRTKNKRVLREVPEARDGFSSLSACPPYKRDKRWMGLPNSKRLSRDVILLPVRPRMGKDDVQAIVDKL